MTKKLKLEEVQKNLEQLVLELQKNGGYLEITKNNHTAAVMIGAEIFAELRVKNPELFVTKKQPNSKWRLRGSLELIGDIEEGSAEISSSILFGDSPKLSKPTKEEKWLRCSLMENG